MIGIGIAFLVISTILNTILIKEKDQIGQISDPIVATFFLMASGACMTANETIGPLIEWVGPGFDVNFEKIWLYVALPVVLLLFLSTRIGTKLRHKKYGNPERKAKSTKDGVSMNYNEQADQYAKKNGVVDYDVNGNEMTYEESFLVEDTRYAVSVDLDSLKETRTALSENRNEVASLRLPEDRKPELFDYLKSENRITCDYETFKSHASVFQTPHGVYIHKQMSENERDYAINQLLNATSNDLNGYKNAVDWLMQQDENVHYIDSYELYIYVNRVPGVEISPATEKEGKTSEAM